MFFHARKASTLVTTLLFLVLMNGVQKAVCNVVGNNIGAILFGPQNNGANTGNTESTTNHGSSNGNALASNIVDNTNFALVQTAKIVEDALVEA